MSSVDDIVNTIKTILVKHGQRSAVNFGIVGTAYKGHTGRKLADDLGSISLTQLMKRYPHVFRLTVEHGTGHSVALVNAPVAKTPAKKSAGAPAKTAAKTAATVVTTTRPTVSLAVQQQLEDLVRGSAVRIELLGSAFHERTKRRLTDALGVKKLVPWFQSNPRFRASEANGHWVISLAMVPARHPLPTGALVSIASPEDTVKRVLQDNGGLMTLVELQAAFDRVVAVQQPPGRSLQAASGARSIADFVERCDGVTVRGNTVAGMKVADKSLPFAPGTVRVVSLVSQADSACQWLSGASFVAVDCEGVELGQAGGRLCLVQVSDGQFNVLFDVVKTPALLARGSALWSLLEGPVVKVMHDCRMDMAALTSFHGAGNGGGGGGVLKVANVLDSQVAFEALRSPSTGRTNSVGLNAMLTSVLGKEHPLKAAAPHKSNPLAWLQRPLPDEAVSYAACDVALLHEAAGRLLDQIGRRKLARRVQALSESRCRSAVANFESEALTNSFDSSPSSSVVNSVLQTMMSGADAVDRRPCTLQVTHSIDELFAVLPPAVRDAIERELPNCESELVDVVMDMDRPVVLRGGGSSVWLRDLMVNSNTLAHVGEHTGDVTDANRACVGSSLHRCSFITDPFSDEVVGLTLRMARVVRGLADTIADVVGSGKSLLLVGVPGCGKTTLLRDIARLLASEQYDRSVMVVDTNNEIAGEGDLPHPAIGRARRMKVGARSGQYRRMLEAVQNHTPQSLVIDEIGTRSEVMEAVGITQRGVQLIATTHGRTLADIIENPDLRNLLGGVNTVILSASERQMEGATSKTRIERRMKPAFDCCIELLALNRWRLHHNVAEAVDVVLRGMGEVVECEVRQIVEGGRAVLISHEVFPDPDMTLDLASLRLE